MTKSAPKLYVNQFSGEIKRLRKHEAKKLTEDWTEIEFVKNDQGVPVMRLQLNGATVDISENDAPAEIPEVTDRESAAVEGEIINGK